ncbi:MAG: hypothetical protein ACKVOP_11100 [Sphingomonadaceae bacterium]
MNDPMVRAMSRWDNEGGATDPDVTPGDHPPMTQAELTQLRIRTIALENVVIALLEGASEDQRASVRAMAAAIAPQAGSTPHPLTRSATLHMNHLVDRAEHFRALR